MTRESKIGLIVAGSFLCLVCIVVASKWRRGDAPSRDPAEPSEPKVAAVHPTQHPAPEAKKEGASKKSSFGNTVKFTTDQGVVYIDGNANPPAVSNDDKAADCTLNMAFSDFDDMINGKLDGMTAFMTGKLKIEGDMGVAMKLQSILR